MKKPPEIEVRGYRPEDSAALGFVPDGAHYGLTITEGARVGAYGGLTVVGSRFWAFFWSEPMFVCRRGRIIHSMVRRGLKDAAARGIAPIYTLRDGRLSTSARWLRLLGFRELADHEKDEELITMQRTVNMGIWRRG